MTVESQLRALGDRLDEDQRSITLDEIRADRQGIEPTDGHTPDIDGHTPDDVTMERPVRFDLEERAVGPHRRQGRSRAWIAGAAAAFVLLIAAIVVVVSRDDATSPAVTPPTPQITTPDTLPSSDSAVAEQFVTAINERDVDAAGALVVPGASIAISPVAPIEALDRDVTIAEQIAWLDAWDYRWDDVTCSVGERSTAPQQTYDQTAFCDAVSRTRLGDVDGVNGSDNIEMRLLDDRIVYVDWNSEFPMWIPSFRAFKEWAENQKSERWQRAWNDDGPLLTQQSSEIESELLEEYIAFISPPAPVTERSRSIPASNPVTLTARDGVVWVLPDFVPEDLISFTAFDSDYSEFDNLSGPTVVYTPEDCHIDDRGGLPRSSGSLNDATWCERWVAVNIEGNPFEVDDARIPDVDELEVAVRAEGLTESEQAAVVDSLRAVPEVELPRPPFVSPSRCCDEQTDETAPIVFRDPSRGNLVRAHSDGSSVALLTFGGGSQWARTTPADPVMLTLSGGGPNPLFYGITEPEVVDLVMTFDDGSLVVIPTEDLSGRFRNQFFRASVPSRSEGENWRTIIARDEDGKTIAVYDVYSARSRGIRRTA